MKQKIYFVLSFLVIISAVFLRFYQFENRAAFDWDQARDYKAVSEIVSGKFTLIGPVAKGEGGFLLGPLYYYLAVPGFILSRGNPASLPVTSIILDLLTIGAILILFPKIWGRGRSLIMAGIWSLSWFAIEASKISWNVALLPLWSVLFIACLLRMKKNFLSTLWLGVLAGLSWHIHASLIPLSPLIVLYSLFTKQISIKNLPAIILGYLIPLVPLIIFDLRHAGFNYYLITEFAHASSNLSWNLGELLVSVFSRHGKNIVGILTGSSDLHLMVGVSFVLLSIYHAIFGTKIGRLSGVMSLMIVALVVLLHESSFPEYYLGVSYLPTLIIFVDTLMLFKFKNVPIILAMLIVGYLNLSHYTTSGTPFSLANKLAIVDSVANLNVPVKIHYDLVYGRDQGIIPLIGYRQIKQDKASKTHVVISEKQVGELYIDGELATPMGSYGGMRLAKHVVQ